MSKLSKSAKEEISRMKEQRDPNYDIYQDKYNELASRMKIELPKVINKIKQDKEEAQYVPSINTDLLSEKVMEKINEEIEDLETSVSEILATMQELNKMFTQTLKKLQEQKTTILQIGQTIPKAQDDMKDGNVQLDKAQDHQKGSTRNLCWILIVIFIVAIGVEVMIKIKMIGIISEFKKSLASNGNVFEIMKLFRQKNAQI